MPELLSQPERAWLLDEQRRLISRQPRPFLNARILEPTPQCFPEPIEPGERGVGAVLGRLLAHAGLAGLELEPGPLERIGEPELLVATLCREVARAWRHTHRLAEDEREPDGRLIDLTTVHLGFGLLTTNASFRYRGAAEWQAVHAPSGGAAAHLAALPPEAMSFLLAVQVKARGLGWWARRNLVSQLEANQASGFRWAYRVLEPPHALRLALGLERAPLALVDAGEEG
jgi:hypothetical protein